MTSPVPPPITPDRPDAHAGWPYRQEADPGSPKSGRVALILALLLTLTAVLMQNVPPMVAMVEESLPGESEAESAEAADLPAVPPPSFSSMVDIMGRLYVKLGEGVAADPNAMPTIEGYAINDAERVRLVVVDAEVRGAEEAVARADRLLASVAEDDPLHADLVAFKQIYTDGPDGLDDEERDRLSAHHGFFGEVALTHGLGDDDPARADLLSGGMGVMILLGGFGLVFVLAVIAGVALFIVGLFMVYRGSIRPRMPVPAPGGSVYLETFAIFVAGFLLLQLISAGIMIAATPEGGIPPGWTGYVPLLLQWLLLLVPLWPRLRGMSGERLAGTVGWHRGQGFFKEVGCGILGYLAGLPLFLAGALLSVILMVLFAAIMAAAFGGPEDGGAAPSNPLIEMIGGSDPLQVILLFLLATVWAPLCEELIFRGALHRHFRGRLGVAGAAVCTASVFGFMHGYGPLLVFPLIALGMVFSFLREWRGSLVACITAHAVHNTVALSVAITLIRVLGAV